MPLLRIMRTAAARRRVVARLAPYVERTAWARGPVPEGGWLAPRPLGFVSGAIDGIAQAEGALGSDALASVQLDAWARLTGGAPELFAARLSVLSAQGDADVMRGREAGLGFARAVMAGDDDAARRAWDAGVTEAL